MDGIAAVFERLQLAIDEMGRVLLAHLPELLGATALMLIGWLVAGWLRRLTRTLGARLNRLSEILVRHRQSYLVDRQVILK